MSNLQEVRNSKSEPRTRNPLLGKFSDLTFKIIARHWVVYGSMQNNIQIVIRFGSYLLRCHFTRLNQYFVKVNEDSNRVRNREISWRSQLSLETSKVSSGLGRITQENIWANWVIWEKYRVSLLTAFVIDQVQWVIRRLPRLRPTQQTFIRRKSSLWLHWSSLHSNDRILRFPFPVPEVRKNWKQIRSFHPQNLSHLFQFNSQR